MGLPTFLLELFNPVFLTWMVAFAIEVADRRGIAISQGRDRFDPILARRRGLPGDDILGMLVIIKVQVPLVFGQELQGINEVASAILPVHGSRVGRLIRGLFLLFGGRAFCQEVPFELFVAIQLKLELFHLLLVVIEGFEVLGGLQLVLESARDAQVLVFKCFDLCFHGLFK